MMPSVHWGMPQPCAQMRSLNPEMPYTVLLKKMVTEGGVLTAFTSMAVSNMATDSLPFLHS